MRLTKRDALSRLPLAALAAVAASPALAAHTTQTWPQRPVKLHHPVRSRRRRRHRRAPDPGTLAARWGKPVVIENRPGGDSLIAIQAVLSANDDHTFLWGPSGNFIVHPYLYQKLPYKPGRHSAGGASFSDTILSVGVPASMNINDLADFVKRARAESRQVQFGGGPRHHRAGVRLFRATTPGSLDQGALPRHRAGGERSRRGSAAGLFLVLRDPAAAARGRPDQGPGADGPRAGAEPARHPDRASKPASRRSRWTAWSACSAARPWPRALREQIGDDVVAVADDKDDRGQTQRHRADADPRRREGVRRDRSRANAPRSPRSPKRSISSRRGDGGVTDARLAAGRPQLNCLEAQSSGPPLAWRRTTWSLGDAR